MIIGAFESHLYGIETSKKLNLKRQEERLNRTFMELKLCVKHEKKENEQV